MIRILVAFGVLATAIGCSNSEISNRETLSEVKDSTENPYESTKELSSKIIFTDSLGYGYQIYEGQKLLINQTHIPSIPSNLGFVSPEAAQLTANFILYKLSNDIFPPSITVEELDSLGVLPEGFNPK